MRSRQRIDEALLQIAARRVGLRSDSAVKMVRSRPRSARARRKNSLATRLGLPMPSGRASTTFLPTRRNASSTISPTSSNICGMALNSHAQTGGSIHMSLKKPALDPMSLEPRTGSGYPEPYRSRVLPREKRALGDALGLKKIGINQTMLPPGKESSMRHWHTHEEEFIYVLSGEVVLRTDAGEQTLTAGMCAGFPLGHQRRTSAGESQLTARRVPGDQQSRSGRRRASIPTSTCNSTAPTPR